MRTITTKEGLAAALKNGETVKVEGPIKQTLLAKRRKKKFAKIAGIATIAAGLVALPFTGGASSAAIAGGVGLTVGTVTISTAELAIICGTGLSALGIIKGAKTTYRKKGKDWEVIVEPK